MKVVTALSVCVILKFFVVLFERNTREVLAKTETVLTFLFRAKISNIKPQLYSLKNVQLSSFHLNGHTYKADFSSQIEKLEMNYTLHCIKNSTNGK